LDNRLSTAFTLLLVCIIFACGSALHDGSVAESLISALAAIAFLCVGIFARPADVGLAARSLRGLKLVAAIPAIWMVFQLLPTPIGAHSIWSYANDALGWQSWGHVSIDLGMTVLAAVFYLANVALVIVTVFVARDRRNAALLLFVLTAITPLLTLVLLLSRSQLIPGFDAGDFSEALSAIGAFGILLSLTAALRTLEEREIQGDERSQSIQRDRLTFLGCGIALAIGLLGVGIGATLNVYLITVFGVVTFGSIDVIRRTALPGWAALMLVTTLIIAAAMIVVWRYDPTRTVSPLLQFATNSPADAVAVTQRQLSDTRWLGAGAGTYEALFPLYQDLGNNAVTKPPSTASVLAIELGWPMLVFVIAAAAWLILALYRGGLARGRDSYYPAAAAACTIVILGEAFCNTSLLSSCVAILGDTMIGLGLAQRFSPRNAQ
jgi:hypothetical protein